jgi:nucleoid-associated protein YgaU
VRRKAVGLLLLALVVVAGIVFVEYGSPRRAKPASDSPATMRVVIGGEPTEPTAPAEPAAKALERVEPSSPPAPTQPEPVPAPTGPDSFRYTVRAGDTLSRIAWEHLGSSAKDVVQRIVEANGLASPDRIRPGDALVVPVRSARQVIATGSETLADIAAREYGNAGATQALRRANPGLPATDVAVLERGTRLWIAH